jgi:hypothetical protein
VGPAERCRPARRQRQRSRCADGRPGEAVHAVLFDEGPRQRAWSGDRAAHCRRARCGIDVGDAMPNGRCSPWSCRRHEGSLQARKAASPQGRHAGVRRPRYPTLLAGLPACRLAACSLSCPQS